MAERIRDVEGFILAGGRSARFGEDKALARSGGRTLLGRARRAVEGLGITPRIVSRDVTRYAAHGLAFVVSERPGEGPAEGLRAALAACGAPWALVLAVDMPGVDTRFLRALLDARDGAAAAPRAVCCVALGRRHPFPGLYHASVAAELAARPVHSMQELLERVETRLLGEGDAGVGDLAARLRNVNRPEDLVS